MYMKIRALEVAEKATEELGWYFDGLSERLLRSRFCYREIAADAAFELSQYLLHRISSRLFTQGEIARGAAIARFPLRMPKILAEGEEFDRQIAREFDALYRLQDAGGVLAEQHT